MRFFNETMNAEMAPLDCMGSFLALEMCLGTLETTLAGRWGVLAEKHPALQIAADFWPTGGLLSVLGELDSFEVRGLTDELLASTGPDPKDVVRLEPNGGSFRLRYPWDLLRVQEDCLKDLTESKIEGTFRELAVNDGVLYLGEGSEVLPGVYVEGVAVVGKNCKIGPNAYLRGFNFIGDKCHIGQAVEIKNSILMHHVSAGHLTYIGDTIVCPDTNFGAGTILSNFRHDGKNHRSMVQGELVDTGRRKFGSVIGAGVHTGIHTSIYPGRKLWAGVSTRPGDVVQRDLRD